jgi:hypothetical protein
MADVDTEELKVRLICADCVGEAFLSARIEREGNLSTCHYCEGEGKTFSLERMAECTSTAFSQHYQRTDVNPTGLEYAMMNDKESPREWYRHGELITDLIQEIAEIDEEPAKDIQQILRDENAGDPFDYTGEEEEFDDESQYEPKKLDDETWRNEWSRFEHSLKTEARYFSEEARAHLGQIFDEIDKLRTQAGASVVVEAGPKKRLKAFYRARTFEAWSRLEPALTSPDIHLAPPPPEFALNGRMNPRGISVFYGANRPEVALAEVRPPVGARVVLARFELMRRVRLLDLKAFADVHEKGSVFDPTYAPRRERALFLKSLVRRLTMPVMPSDEALEYLPTQAIADFLASRHDPELDGILFPSVQVKGQLNVVLFHKAARVAPIEYPEGTKVSMDTGMFNGEEYEYELTVLEEVPPSKPTKKKSLPGAFAGLDLGNLPSIEWDTTPDPDSRPMTLKVDLSSLEVREVKGVRYTTENDKVSRRRTERDDRPDDF